MAHVPELRIRTTGDAAVNADGDYVLYWMIAYRRPDWNFGLQRAVELCRELKKPLVILEALRCSYRWASDRIHQFVIQGMADNERWFSRKPVLYFPYLEPVPGAGQGLLAALSRPACVVVSDDFPCFFLPRMIRAASAQVPVRFELIDSNGLLPMRAASKVFSRAFDLRRFLQKNLLPHLDEMPDPDPLLRSRLPKLERLPAEITNQWPAAEVQAIARDATRLKDFPIDHSVTVAPVSGGAQAAHKHLQSFLDASLSEYASGRNQPHQDGTSGLSPYLHFGHISPHQVFVETIVRDGWSPHKVAEKATGSVKGWWGASEGVEAFLDQLITWRELGYNMCWQRDDYDKYESLPDWAQRTLAEHAQDRRDPTYAPDQFEAADTHDELWNAAQRQLIREGRMHNYLRMLWGKKILHWSESPQAALSIMTELNNKYALDGRNPSSYSGIFWVLGRYDRAWGPERPVFGKIRYMASENTARKLRVGEYLRRYR